jgi:WD40 repeat protein
LIGEYGLSSVYLFDDKHNFLWRYNTEGPAYELSISSDGSYIISGTRGAWIFLGVWPKGKIYFFGWEDNAPLWSYQTGGPVFSVSISSDGSYAVVGSDDNRIYFFGREENTPLWSYQTGGPVHSVAISSDGSYAVAGSSDNRIYFFGREENIPLWSYRTGGEVLSVAISSDGTYVIAGSSDDRSYLFARRILPPAVLGILPYVMAGVIMAIVIGGSAFMLKKRFA